MKLRFVKFFTSRENEIEKKEEGGRNCMLCRHQARPRPEPMLHLLFPPSFPLSLPPPSPTNLPPPSPQLVGRHVPPSNCSSYPSSSCSASPFLLHKLPKRKSVERRTVAGRPAVLPNDNTAGAQLARHPCSFIQSVAAASLRFQWHPLCGDWSHMKTKTENELSCSITFIDE